MGPDSLPDLTKRYPSAIPPQYRNLDGGTNDELLVEYARDLVSFLKKHSFIFDCRAIDFFASNLWQSFPDEWRETCENMSTDELLDLQVGITRTHWSKSLVEFVETVRRLSMRRDPYYYDNIDNVDNNDDDGNADHARPPSPTPTPTPLEARVKMGMRPKKLHEVERVSQLIHETITRVTTTTTTAAENIHVVDIGSGEGYLSRALTFQYGFNVIGVDCEDSLTRTAREKNDKMRCFYTNNLLNNKQQQQQQQQQQQPEAADNNKSNNKACDWCRAGRQSSVASINCITGCISSNMSEENFMALIAPAMQHNKHKNSNGNSNSNDNNNDNEDKLVIIGLHTCGDLAPTMLKLFLNIKRCVAFVGIGCCYYKGNLQCDADNEEFSAEFPLSRTVRDLGIVESVGNLKAILKLACDFIHRRPTTQSEWDEYHHDQKTIRFRCVLEDILANKVINNNNTNNSNSNNNNNSEQVEPTTTTTRTRTKRIKVKPPRLSKKKFRSISFSEYAALVFAAEQHLLPPPLHNDDDNNHHHLDMVYNDVYAPRFGLLEAFTALRTLVSPLLESLIILDRILFVQEHQQQQQQQQQQQGDDTERFEEVRCHAIPIFDPIISPRNIVLVLEKKQKQKQKQKQKNKQEQEQRKN